MTTELPAAASAVDDAIAYEAKGAANLCAAVAEEMRIARNLLEKLASTLVADERFVLDYIEQFQDFDLIVQHIDESAKLLDSYAQDQCVKTAVDSVRLTAVQQRLRAQLD